MPVSNIISFALVLRAVSPAKRLSLFRLIKVETKQNTRKMQAKSDKPA
jgi:hypothetical protein